MQVVDGLALADFDGDGDIDLYSTNQGLSPLINDYDNIPEPFEDDGGPVGYPEM